MKLSHHYCIASLNFFLFSHINPFAFVSFNCWKFLLFYCHINSHNCFFCFTTTLTHPSISFTIHLPFFHIPFSHLSPILLLFNDLIYIYNMNLQFIINTKLLTVADLFFYLVQNIRRNSTKRNIVYFLHFSCFLKIRFFVYLYASLLFPYFHLAYENSIVIVLLHFHLTM